MIHKIATEVILNRHNGFIEDAKFVEIEGVKYVADEADATKPKLDEKGEKVVFKVEDKKGSDEDTLEERAKKDPVLAKLLDDNKKLQDDLAKRDRDAKKKADEEAEKKGEWQKIADDRKTELEKLTETLAKKEDMLGKYVNSTKQILKEVLETIPAEKRGLIPENFSPREKLEYITKNAKVLGAKVGVGGGGVPKNDNDPPTTDEGKIINEIEELRKKENKTQSDHTKIFELSKKLKEIRTTAK